MNWLSQVIAVTGVTLRSISQRLGSSTVAIIGIAGVVVVFITVLSIAEGFRAAMTEAGDPRTAIIMRAASDTEMSSTLSGDEARIILDAPGIERDDEGPYASSELFVIVNHPMRRSGTDANVPLRGVSPAVLKVRNEVKITEGRMFELGRNEIIVGRAASRQFSGLDVGTSVRWGENTWTVVGIFESNGSVSESELWCDARVLQPAYRRGNSYNSIYAKLTSAESFQTLKDALTTDPRLTVMVVRENDYYAEQGLVLQAIIRYVGFGIAALMALGAIFGAVNTMYTAVATRTREIATFRALGFGSSPIVVSVLVEALLLSLVGGLAGGLLAWAAFDGYQTATVNWQTFSQVAFAFRVTPSLLFMGIFCASVMGLLGGLFPPSAQPGSPSSTPSANSKKTAGVRS
jgi:putative ABC transport system permease protein